MYRAYRWSWRKLRLSTAATGAGPNQDRLPLLLPGIVASGLFAFVSAWNEFFFALVLLKSPQLTTLPVYLSRFTGSEGMTRLGPLAASCLVATIPTLVVFTFLQKGLVSGLMSGAVKQ